MNQNGQIFTLNSLVGLKQVKRYVSLLFVGLLIFIFLGWDYSTRFVSLPVAGGTNFTAPALRSFNVKNHIPVDLNSILRKLHIHSWSGTILHSFQTRQTLFLQISTCQGDMLIAPSPQNTELLRRIFALESSICSGILRNLHSTISI